MVDWLEIMDMNAIAYVLCVSVTLESGNRSSQSYLSIQPEIIYSQLCRWFYVKICPLFKMLSRCCKHAGLWGRNRQKTNVEYEGVSNLSMGVGDSTYTNCGASIVAKLGTQFGCSDQQRGWSKGRGSAGIGLNHSWDESNIGLDTLH